MDRGKLLIENSHLKTEIARLRAKIAEYSTAKNHSKPAQKLSNQPVKPTVSMISPKENLLEFLESQYQASKKSTPAKPKPSPPAKSKPPPPVINRTAFATYN